MADMAWAKLWEEATNAVEAVMSGLVSKNNKDEERVMHADSVRTAGNIELVKTSKNNTLPIILIVVIIIAMLAMLFFKKK